MTSGRDGRWAWAAGASGLLLSLWLLQPGYMSFDSAYQWQQGRLGQYDDGHPPLMAMLWGVVDRVVLLAGSAEFRYLAWPVLAALLAPPLLVSKAAGAAPPITRRTIE